MIAATASPTKSAEHSPPTAGRSSIRPLCIRRRSSRTLGEQVPVGLEGHGNLPSMSAYWLTAILSTDIALTGATGRAAGPGTGKSAVRQSRSPPSCWINPAAFTTPAPGTLSAVGKQQHSRSGILAVRYGARQGVSRSAKHTRRVPCRGFQPDQQLPRRHFASGSLAPELARRLGYRHYFGTPTFGQITSALDPRILQLAMKFSF